MALLVQTILDNFRNVVLNITGTTTDSGTVIDPTLLDPPCTKLRIMKCVYDVGGAVSLNWDATAAVPALQLTSGSGQTMCFEDFGGIPNNAGAGITGKLLIAATGTGTYSIILTLVKSDPLNKL